ncbi:unnamed protein product [Oikopleura dioica]|uniref:Probable RNA polymerase II nuclear localization protein SLC7A6OS n=1 Tax=Oikopleura dioica TaxID=34765 RepID=E4XQZ1_OIKDI|nr:unnamed protein product [Oikopleura dioica]
MLPSEICGYSENDIQTFVDIFKMTFTRFAHIFRHFRITDDDTARFYDILYEEIENRKQVDISLNGAKLIRENLSLADNARKSSESDNEYVYDIYYTNDVIQDVSDMLVFESYDSDFLMHTREEEADWKNDSDSNDEENWRNDYPDEDSSDEARSYDSLTRSDYSDFNDETNEENDYDPTEIDNY